MGDANLIVYIISPLIFTSVILLLVGMLLFVEAKVVRKGNSRILINEDEDKSIEVAVGNTLLAALVNNKIFLPSACGGGGSCGQCRCTVNSGGGDVMPTELAHLTRNEKKNHIRLACQLKVRQDLNIRIPDEIFSIKKYDATVISNQNVATFIKELVLKLDEDQGLDFIAGAYIQIDIPEYDLAFKDMDVADRYRNAWEKFNLWSLAAHSEEPVYRAYSLANPPYEKSTLKFTIRIATPPPTDANLPPGVGSSYIFNLKPKDQVTLSGPYGDFFVKDTDREICFIGGGAGMAPMRCHILNQLNDIQTARKISFWYGARSSQEMFYGDEFSALAEKYDNFSYHVALSEPLPEDNWQGLTGFIHQCLRDHHISNHPDPTEIEFYLCGPPMMIDAVIQMLDDYGVEPEMIAYDKF